MSAESRTDPGAVSDRRLFELTKTGSRTTDKDLLKMHIIKSLRDTDLTKTETLDGLAEWILNDMNGSKEYYRKYVYAAISYLQK